MGGLSCRVRSTARLDALVCRVMGWRWGSLELPGFLKADILASILKQDLNIYSNNVSMLFYLVEGASLHQ